MRRQWRRSSWSARIMHGWCQTHVEGVEATQHDTRWSGIAAVCCCAACCPWDRSTTIESAGSQCARGGRRATATPPFAESLSLCASRFGGSIECRGGRWSDGYAVRQAAGREKRRQICSSQKVHRQQPSTAVRQQRCQCSHDTPSTTRRKLLCLTHEHPIKCCSRYLRRARCLPIVVGRKGAASARGKSACWRWCGAAAAAPCLHTTTTGVGYLAITDTNVRSIESAGTAAGVPG